MSRSVSRRPTPSRLLLMALLVAGLSADQARMASAADAPTYSVEPGDQIQIVVQGAENASTILSGRFRIETDGSIQYPLLGKLEVAGSTPSEISDLLLERLLPLAQISSPAVSVVEFAPVFVVGDVARTGSYQFRPDMTVFDLILQAGGVSRSEAPERARAAILQELSTINLEKQSLAMQRKRLQAELQGSDLVDADPKSPPRLVSAEAAIFAARLGAKQARQRSYDAQRNIYDQEIASIEAAIRLHDDEVRLLEEQLGVQENLAQRGLAVQSARREAERQLTSSRRDGIDFRIALFRAKQNRLSIDRTAAEAEARVDEENLRALRDVELALHRYEIASKFTTARLADLEARVEAQSNIWRHPYYRVIRLENGHYKSRIVDGLAKLARGDVVQVDVVIARTGASQSTGQPSYTD